MKIHREKPKADFLGIKNENWMAASRTLGPHALRLYLYLAANADNYELALSPAAVMESIGMARSTYHDQFHKLENMGYLVNTHGNTYEFYEVPQSGTQQRLNELGAGHDFENNPPSDMTIPIDGLDVMAEGIEINKDIIQNRSINNGNFIPSKANSQGFVF